ncbi:MAG: ATP synthase F1 subunit gamma [Abditibacteriales bacterium]|nr:ATP synthase F1 subunit gamma [Abditibacteriales bacterium]MDW8364777.1 ATP synthase F1 subunit gamma [Abditibacteriales bacterium]
MPSLRDIRRKIRTVNNIKQITQAMKMVAAARLKKVQDRVTAGKPYAEKLQELMGYLAPHVTQIQHPLLEVRPIQATGVVVIAGDKGLCGSYNNNIIRRAQQFLNGLTVSEKLLITIGRKSTEFFRKRGYRVHASFPQIGVDAPYAEIKRIADAITGLYLSQTVDEVYIAYTEFVSSLQQRPQVIKFLPIEPPQTETTAGRGTPEGALEYIFEPPAPELLATLLPRYVEQRIYHLLLESVASEFGARMTAMTNATDNAGELIKELTLAANKARQASITKELLEVVSGAEALKG